MGSRLAESPCRTTLVQPETGVYMWHCSCPATEAMTTRALLRHVETGPKTEPACLLRWTFSLGAQSMTCQLEADRSASAFYVCLVPHWSLASSAIEYASDPIEAFRRHAEIAMQLRALGWSLTRRSH